MRSQPIEPQPRQLILWASSERASDKLYTPNIFSIKFSSSCFLFADVKKFQSKIYCYILYDKLFSIFILSQLFVFVINLYNKNF